MTEHIVRDWVTKERLDRGLAEYYSRRVKGVRCPDPLGPEERASIESSYGQRLQSARMFIQARPEHANS